MKLTIKIPLIMGIVVLVSALAIIIAVNKYVRESMEKTILFSLGSEVHSSANFLESKLQGQMEVISEISNRIGIRSMDMALALPALKHDVERLDATDLAVATPEGISSYVIGNNTLDIKDRSYFKRALAGEKNVEIIISRINGSIVAMFAVPIYQNDDKNAPIVGVLIARKEGGKALSNIVAGIWTAYKSGYTYLLNEEGTVIGHKNQSLVTSQFNPIRTAETDKAYESMANMAKTAIQKKEGIAEYTNGGKNIICSYTQIKGYPWVLFLAIDKDEMNDELSRITKDIAIIGFICFIIGIIIALIVGRLIANPIARILAVIKGINQSEVDLTKNISVQSKDEVGDLAINLNKLMETMRIPIVETKNVISNLTADSEELSKISNELNEASEETVKHASNTTSRTERMSENINTMASGAEQASANASEVASAAEEMSVNMNTVAAAIEEMSASIREIANNTSEVHSIATDATAKAVEATDVMDKLGAAAKEIGKVTDVIKKIADKTSLLALNATIEAASAGEAGKGFAVVASEIKELANQSARSADDIAHRIESIQTGTNNAVKVISDVSGIIENINLSVKTISDHVSQQTKASNEIANNVSQASAGSKRVAGSIGEVAKGANNVSKNAGDAARRTVQVADEIAIMSDEANKSNQSASKLKASAGGLNSMANDLRTVMGKFKV